MLTDRCAFYLHQENSFSFALIKKRERERERERERDMIYLRVDRHGWNDMNIVIGQDVMK